MRLQPVLVEGSALVPLGNAVRRARRDQGLTLRALAAAAGLSERFLSDLEKGRGNISIGRLVQVSRALRMPVSELVAPLDFRRPCDVPRVALVGLRGAGKSTVGPLVASALGVPFAELDAEVEARAALPLARIFEIHGEAYYRRLEREVGARLLSEAVERGVVLATGGGLVTDHQTWRRVKAIAVTVWLSATPEDHYRRVMVQGDLRPMANRPFAMQELRALLDARTPMYAEADFSVFTSELSPQAVVEAVVSGVRRGAGSSSVPDGP